MHKLYNNLSNPSLPTPKPIIKYKEKEGEDETEITIDDEFFYGDIVEFNPYTFDETVISNVYYRFNTAQREMSGNGWTYEVTNLISDDYDENGFSAVTQEFSSYKPEGYYYLPHYKIQLHNIQEEPNRFLAPVVKSLEGTAPSTSDEPSEDTATTLTYVGTNGTTIVGDTMTARTENHVSVTTNSQSGFTFDVVFGSIVKITAATDYDYYVGDVFGICKYQPSDISEANVYWGTVSAVDNVEVEEDGETKTYPVLTIEIKDWPEQEVSLSDEFALTDGTIPQYAIYNPLEQTFIWKDVILPSETPSNASTYNMPFSNGSFYIHQNITFFLRRQDPFGVYGLQDTFDYGSETKYEDETEEEFKQRVNPERYFILKLREREVATNFLKFAAVDIINNCL